MKLFLLQKTINLLYHFFEKTSYVRQNKITFCTNRSQELTGNLNKIYLEFQEKEGIEIKVICFNYNRSLIGRLQYLTYSISSLYQLATSRVFVLDDYFLPIYCIQKKNNANIVIQVWHAIGHLKKYGLSIAKNRESHLKHHSNYDWVLANSSADCEALSESFDIEKDRIFVTGAPRLDDLINDSVKIIDKEGYKVLYAPTYRNAQDNDPVYSYINQFLLEFSKKYAESSMKLYVSLHPYLKIEKIDKQSNDNIIIFQDTALSSQLLKEADCLVTDYSSILLDYSFFEKPIKIYAPDYEEYIKNVGFFVDYQSYLGLPIALNAREVIANLTNYSIEERKNISRLKEENFPFLDGRNSKRAYEFINSFLND